MNIIIILICGLFILLGFEIRYRLIAEDIEKLRNLTSAMEKEVTYLQQEIKMKKNIYEEIKP